MSVWTLILILLIIALLSGGPILGGAYLGPGLGLGGLLIVILIVLLLTGRL